MLLEKYASERIPALKNSRFWVKTPFCFYMEKHLIKEVNNFWCCDCDCASTATRSSEKFNTRMFLNSYFKIVPLFPQKRLISPLTAILFLHEKVLTERVGMFWWRNHNCVSIVTELCEEFNRNVLLNIFSEFLPTSSCENGLFYDTLPFCFFMEDERRNSKIND